MCNMTFMNFNGKVGPQQLTIQASRETYFAEFSNALWHLQKAGLEPAAIAYTDNDCVVTLSATEEDWDRHVNTLDPVTGFEVQGSDATILGKKAFELGLASGSDNIQDGTRRAIEAGYTVVQNSMGRREAIQTQPSESTFRHRHDLAFPSNLNRILIQELEGISYD
jgi:hypothetical protein